MKQSLFFFRKGEKTRGMKFFNEMHKTCFYHYCLKTIGPNLLKDEDVRDTARRAYPRNPTLI